MNIDVWNSLDGAARANLPSRCVSDFFNYKKELRDDGHQWEDDAEDILRGFIWEMVEITAT